MRPGREDERDRRARHQHVEVDRAPDARRGARGCQSSMSSVAVEERHGLPGRVARRRDGQRVQPAGGDLLRDAVRAGSSRASRSRSGDVSNSERGGWQQPAGRDAATASSAARTRSIVSESGPDDLLDVEVGPDLLERSARASRNECARAPSAAAFSAPADVPTSTSNGHGASARQPFGDRLQHADLVRAARPAARQDQGVAVARRRCSWSRRSSRPGRRGRQ